MASKRTPKATAKNTKAAKAACTTKLPAARALKQFGNVVVDENVHHSSLAAFARERLTKGEPIDLPGLGLSSILMVKVTEKSK